MVDTERDGNPISNWEVLDQFSMTLAHNESNYHTYELQPTMLGEDLRVVFLHFKGDVPSEPSRENSYRDLHIWIDVVESEE